VSDVDEQILYVDTIIQIIDDACICMRYAPYLCYVLSLIFFFMLSEARRR
jgi:hypothetical protein